MLGNIVNALAIIAGGLAGLFLRGGIQERYRETLMQAVGLCVVLIGISSSLKTGSIMIVILSLVIGSLIGEFIRIEARLDSIGKYVEKRLSGENSNFSKGFVQASLIFCVGSMAIIGSIESGLTGSHQTLFAKSVLDGVTTIILTSVMGAGVIMSCVSVFIYQSSITLLATFIKPFMTPDVIAQMSSAGGLLIIAIGLNMLEVGRIRAGNMLPAIFMPFIYTLILNMTGLSSFFAK